MPKRLWLIILFPLFMLGLILGIRPTLNVQAIAEVTPTPVPDANPSTMEINVQELLTEVWNNLESEDFEVAIETAGRVIAAEPDNAEAYLLRAIAYRQLGRYTLAVDDLTIAIDLVPGTYHPIRAVAFPINTWTLYSLRAEIYVEMGDPGAALLDYEETIALYPLFDSGSAFAGRASLNYQMGDTAAGDVDDSIALGLERMGSGDNSGAIDFFNDALSSGQASLSVASAYYARGLIYESQGNHAAAFDDWSRAIENYPEMHLVHLVRGITYREAGDIEAAGRDFYNRLLKLGIDFVEQDAAIGDEFDIEMDYRRVVMVSFEGNAGNPITIAARETGDTSTDPLIALIDPSGRPIAGDDDFGGDLDALISDLILPTTGTYTLVIGHAEGAYADGFEGTITVSIQPGNASGD